MLGSVKGMKYYNNGVINKRIREGDPIPEGFVPGMKPRSAEVRRRALEKTKQTNLERYGVENVFQSEDIKNKSKQTCLEKYGVEYYQQTEEFQETYKNSMQEKYGVDNSFQAEEVKAKIRETLLNKYGTSHPLQSEEVKNKMRQTNLERYGVEYLFQSKEARSKATQTMILRYGYDHPSHSVDVQQRKEETCLQHYGVKYPAQSKEVQEKLKQVNLNNLGVCYPSQSEKVREKIKKSNIKNLGVPNPSQSELVKQKVSETCLEKYGVPWACMRPEARNYSNNSKPNRKFAELLDKYGIPYEREFHINAYSYDFKIGNILIEIDPYATHNSLWNSFGREGLRHYYHLNKTLTAEKHGYHCIHIFDWNKYKDMINKFIVSAEPFTGSLEDYFIKLEDNSYIFSEYRIKHISHIEDIMKGFIEKHNHSSIKVYSDRSKFPSSVYKSLGFKIESELEPHCNWYSPKSKEVIVKPFNLGLGRLDRRGFVPVFDCGSVCYRLNR